MGSNWKLIFLAGALLLLPVGMRADGTEGSTFSEVWSTVTSDPYALPHNKMTIRSFFGFLHDRLKEAGKRTIADHRDLLPRFNKLVHPNGICLAGTWNITEDNPYSGYFRKGSQALIVARASVAMSDTVRGKYRGFGFAGKLFPTTDPDHRDPVRTANFFLVDDLGGTLAAHYTDVTMTNQPQHNLRASILAAGLVIVRAFTAVDSNPLVRQLYEVSELGQPEGSRSHTPNWFGLKAAPGQTVDEADFRDELRVTNYGGKLRFDILVADAEQSPWSRIGYIEFTQDAVSDSCDHRLHFHHPKWRENLP